MIPLDILWVVPSGVQIQDDPVHQGNSKRRKAVLDKDDDDDEMYFFTADKPCKFIV